MAVIASRLFVAACLCLSSAGAAFPATPAGLAVQPSLAPMIRRVLPGVVSIVADVRVSSNDNPILADPNLRRFFGLPEDMPAVTYTTRSMGSGIVIDAGRGYLLTNNHMVANATMVIVILQDGRAFRAEVVGTDEETDLAVIRIEATGLHALTFGDSSRLQVGDYVVAIGSPFGLGQTATLGIVSALGRTGLGLEGYEDFIQTDAAINPGSSGGALVDLEGRLVGINSAILGPSGGNIGIGFAIPAGMAKTITEQLIAHGEIRRGRFGVAIQDLTPELAAALKTSAVAGAAVSDIIAGSPAEKAGLKPGDVVTAVGDLPIHGSSELRDAVGMLPPDTEVVVSLVRGSDVMRLTVTLHERDRPQAGQVAGEGLLASIVLGAVPPGTRKGAPADGATVVSVDPESDAAMAGLVEGDVIVSVDQKPVHSPEEANSRAAKGGSQLLLGVLRDGLVHFVVIP